MDTINSWIDQEEVSRLAEGLSSSPEEMKKWRESKFDGFAIPEEQGAVEEASETPVQEVVEVPAKVVEGAQAALAGASALAVAAGVIAQQPESTATVADVKHSEAALDTFAELDQKMRKAIAAEGICVVDRDGDVLFESMDNDALVPFTVAVLRKAPILAVNEDQFGNTRLRISADKLLEFISVKTTRGVIVIASVVKQSLGAETARKVADEALAIANR